MTIPDQPDQTAPVAPTPEQTARPRGFEPARHLTRISGAEYLEVKWRVVWFREVHPHGSIETELVRFDEREAVVKAIVTARDGTGRPLGSATGYGSEKPGDFRDYLEKAETKAIGRALANMGFGTQFSVDLDTGDRVVDAPVRPRSGPAPQRVNQPRPSTTAQPDGGPIPSGTGGGGRAASEAQRAVITRLLRETGKDLGWAGRWCAEHGCTTETISTAQASTLIDELNAIKRAGDGGGDQ